MYRGNFMQTRDDFPSIRIGPVLLDESIVLPELPNAIYRGDERGFNDIFNHGFKPRGTNTDYVKHVFEVDGLDFFTDSAYISTSLSIDEAIKFPINMSPGNNRSWVYEIRTKQPAIDVMAEIALKINTRYINPEDFKINQQFQERVCASTIKPKEIKGCWQVLHKKKKILNPENINENIRSKPSLEEIQGSCYEKQRMIVGQYIPNPNYRKIEKVLLKTIKTTTGVLTAVGVGIDSWSLYREYQYSKKLNDYTNTYREASRITGGWSGALLVGSQGAKAGALACSSIPPYGPLACGLAGGIGGSIIGYYAGSETAKKIFDINWSEHYHNITENISKQTSEVTNIFKEKIIPQSKSSFSKLTIQSRGSADMRTFLPGIPSEIPSEQSRFIKKKLFHNVPGASDEINRQDKELQQGEQRLNQMVLDMQKDPITAATFMATIDVRNEVEKVKEDLNLLVGLNLSQGRRVENNLERLSDDNQTLDKKLETLIENNKEVRQQLLVVTENIKKQAEHKKVQENKQGLLDAAGFVSALGQYCGNQDICRMGTLVHASVTIATSMAALQGPMAFASLTPMSAIAVSALTLMSAFAEKGPNINQIMLDAIQSLAQQLEVLRKQMHEQVDKIKDELAQINLRIIDGFCEILNQDKNISEIITDIQNFLRDFKIGTRDYFATVNEKLRNIEDHQLSTGRRKKIEDLYKTIQNADRNHSFDASEFKKGYNEFYSEICGLHVNNPLLVGSKNKNISQIVNDFELDRNNSFAAEFNINSLQNQNLALVNPMIWSWQVMGFMELLKRWYKKEEKAANKITTTELKSLEEVAAIGNVTLNFLHSLRNKELLKQLFNEYIQAGTVLHQQLSHYIEKEEKSKTKELNQELKKTLTERDSKPIFEDFKEEKIPFDTQVKEDWFTAENYNSHSKMGKVWNNTLPYATANNINTKIDSYLQKRQLSVDHKKIEITKDSYKNLKNIDNQFRYFAQPTMRNPSYHALMFPQNPTHPILPLPSHFQFPMLQTVEMAQWLHLGRVEFQYRIEQIEIKQANQAIQKEEFVIDAIWVAENERKALSTLRTSYDSSIYGYNRVLLSAKKPEKIGDVSPKDIVLHKNLGNMTAYWNNNNQLQSRSFPELELKDISASIAAAIPAASNESKDAAFIRTIVTKYECTPKENEKLWWWWTGGECCVSGLTQMSTVYSNTTHEQNTWTHEAYLPVCQEIVGKRDSINKDNLAQNEFKNHLTEESECIRNLKQKISEKEKTMRESFFDDLQKEVVNNAVSPLGKTLIKYSHAYYMLKSTLTLAFGEDTLKLYPEFSYFYDTNVLSHRDRFLSQVSKENVSILKKLNSDLKTCDTQFSQGLTKLFSESQPDSILSLVLKEWNELMNWYKSHDPKDKNTLCSNEEEEKRQHEQEKTYGEKLFLKYCSRAMLSCTEKTSLGKFFKKVKNEMKKDGLELLDNMQGSLQLGSSSAFFDKKPDPKPIQQSWGTADGIFRALTEESKDTAHIINPSLSSTSNLFCHGKEAAAVFENKNETKKVTNGYI